ncbi:ribonuclease H-like domain-containing protein [Tanacetum coccineum]
MILSDSTSTYVEIILLHPQDEIDESLYVYGKKGPHEPEPNVLDDRSSEYSTCQSNDSAGSIGTSSEHFVDPESEISSVPPEVYVSTPITSNEKGTNINTGRTNINPVRPRVNTGSSNINTVKSRQPVPDHPLKNMVDRGIFDSGCSGHMTGNKDQLEDFEEFNGGSVTFGELGHFNLFSISQICDKQHKVLFTETECLVVSSDFKMPDENQILLKVPRHHNMYSFDMKTPTPAKEFSGYSFLASKDETSGILQNFIRQIENQLNHRVKIIRSDNGTEFKNRDMLEFCGNKGIKQEYSNARTPQQNGVAERMNRTLIEAARTMLADSLLPTTFWAEAVSTACYIFNRVRVTKPQNKTPYELLFGHKPIISYIRPFGCHVTILDTLSVLGKFDGKCDEGFLVGYSLNSKAFRVYNLVTKKVEVNLHVKFLEEKPNVKGVGYRWMFDIDYLTDSMNYIPVSLDNQSNPHAGTSEVTNSAGTLQSPNANASEEADEDEELIVVPTAIKHSAAKKEAFSTGISEDTPEILAFRRDLDQLAQKHLREVTTDKATSTNSVNSGSEPANTQPADQDDSDMPELTIFNKPQKGIFDEASYDEEGMVHDFNNLPTEVAVSPIPTLRIHNIHPQSQILGDPKSSVQTRSRVKQTSRAHALEEPKKISKALKDDSWVEAMQEELLQFRAGANMFFLLKLNTPAPIKDYACLIAKATSDESKLWHRRFSWVFFLASKDETSGILQTFIRQIENQLSHRVKIIRSDNGTEFKNRDMLEFCGNKGIKQEYSNARTPQQNGVAERMNRTLIEAARTMLADSLLPTTFWAEAVSTACYIFNRVRVTKPQNKTPYELLFGHKPIISYIRPFGCHVTILDTLSVLGKFDGKSNEGFLVGYSLNSKAYRVYNLVTKRVEVNLHVNFLEDKPNVKGVGYRWMFDIDYLTDSMNYIPVSLENQANPHAGSKDLSRVGSNKITEEKAESRTSSTNSKKEEILTEPQQEKTVSFTDTLEDNPKIQAFFPYLKKDEYEVWAMKMEYWITNNDMNIWKVIQNGNSLKRTGRDCDGRVIILPPTTADEHIAVQRESKARTTLLQSIPDDHVADFHYMDDARDIWNAVKARFGGNAESKKMRKSRLKQEFSEFRICDTEDAIEEGAAKIYKLITGADTKEVSTAGDAGEFALMGVTSERVLQKNQLTLEDKIRVLSIELENTTNLLKHSERINAIAETAKKDLQTKLDNHLVQTEKWRTSSKNLFRLVDSSMSVRTKLCSPPLSGGLTLRLSDHTDLDESQMSYGTKSSTFGDFNSVSNDFVSYDNKPSQNDSISVHPLQCIPHLRVKLEIESKCWAPYQENPLLVQDLPSFSCNSSDKNGNTSRTSCNKNGYFNKKADVGNGVLCDLVHSRNNVNHQNQFVPQAVPFRTGKVNITPARQPVPTGKPKVPAPVPTGTLYPYVPQMYYNHMQYGGDRWATAVKPSAGCSWKTHRKGFYWENSYTDAEDEGIFDSGCSRSMLLLLTVVVRQLMDLVGFVIPMEIKQTLSGSQGLASPEQTATAEVVPKSVAGSSFSAASSMLLPFDVQVQQDF